MRYELTLGATYLGDGRCRFLVWAPQAQTVEVHIVAPQERVVTLEPLRRGYYQRIVEGIWPDSLYLYRLDEQHERPDPASRYQPRDVHGPSAVVDTSFPWQDAAWFGPALKDYLIYELHVGTFTSEGTFEAIIAHLDELKNLGITAIELMPVAQFSGSRNWGYDGVYPYAAQHAYGGPHGLRQLVNACHQRGLAVVLDVVYNHLGPEGNYLGDFGPYFTDRYHTPWGLALNFDDARSDEVRRYFIENALYWITECHIDALRLDAVHAIADQSAYPFLDELAVAVHAQAEALGRRVQVMAESDLDDTRIIRPRALGGFAHDAQWNDGFHHALHTLLTGETDGYYWDYGKVEHLAKAFAEGYVYSGQYSAYRQRRHGNSSRAIPAHQFVVCAQNHDQVGNRMLGERLSQLVGFEGLKVAAAVVLLSPFIPLLFMGEEYGETAPFPYFISHMDADLVEAVRRGRHQEFAAFAWKGEPPDPQSETVFNHAKLNHHLRQEGHHAVLYAFYKALIELRNTVPALAQLSKESLYVGYYESPPVLWVRRWHGDSEICFLAHFGQEQAPVTLPLPAGHWSKRLDSAAAQWRGPGETAPAEFVSAEQLTLTLSPHNIVLFVREEG